MSQEQHELALYYFEACPFCQKVLIEIDRLKLKVDMRDTFKSSDHAATLYRDTGRTTVPCLYIDGKPMHESDDIVRWLQGNNEKVAKI